MATRCIVAEPYGDNGWRGRYVHWDGHPSTKIPQLTKLVRRDGIKKVRKTLLHDNYSWSFINPLYKKQLSELKTVEGYGEAYKKSKSEWFTQRDTMFAWAEYVYVLDNQAIFVWRIDGKGYANFDPKLLFIGEYQYEKQLILK